jgi:thiamine-phosphate pyrophosphorylase
MLADGGAIFVQLRDKHRSPADFYIEAKVALAVARQKSVTLIINDRVDIAMAIGAGGVHLGQEDLPPEAARRLLGDEAIIGYSTHNVSQAIDGAALPVDYIAIGPIFPTNTKANPDPVVGLDGLRGVRQALPAHMPLVAIGGITAENAATVIEAGADSVAIVSALLSGGQTAISNHYRTFLRNLGKTHGNTD